MSQNVGKTQGTWVRTLIYVTRFAIEQIIKSGTCRMVQSMTCCKVGPKTSSVYWSALFVFSRYPALNQVPVPMHVHYHPSIDCPVILTASLTNLKKAKQLLYRHGEVLRAPGVWGSQTIGKWMWQGYEPQALAALPPGNTLVLIPVTGWVDPSAAGRIKWMKKSQ